MCKERPGISAGTIQDRTNSGCKEAETVNQQKLRGRKELYRIEEKSKPERAFCLMYGMPVILVILKTANTWEFLVKCNKYPLKCIAEESK